jgi:GNAT superfamily N-acetyltransferase
MKKKLPFYQDKIGYIKGYWRPDGYFWISEFVINKEFRGKGLARNLAVNIPQKCMLQAQPLFNMGGSIPLEKLVSFYESLGFIKTPDFYGNVIMVRD